MSGLPLLFLIEPFTEFQVLLMHVGLHPYSEREHDAVCAEQVDEA